MEKKGSVFISHHRDTCEQIVSGVSTYLKAVDIFCWYAERDVETSQNYTVEIMEAIRNCDLFVLLLNKYANKSRHVLREVNVAMSHAKPIMIIRLDDCVPNDSIAYVSSILQMISISDSNRECCIQGISEEITKWYDRNPNGKNYKVSYEGYKVFWEGNDLAFYEDEYERGRISTQNKFVYDFAGETYRQLLGAPSDSCKKTFLDIGCNTGVQAHMFIADRSDIRYVGVDREAAALECGRHLYPDACFYQMDCESKAFHEQLSRIEDELDIDGFDYINVSMLLLHLRHPKTLLDVLANHLNEDGQIIILDIDDGFNVAYPDEKGYFKRAVDMCFQLEYSGYRHCGRTIYKMLTDVDLQNVQLHRIGLSTIGMNRKRKEEYYEIYFSFILDDLRKMHEEYPDNHFVATDLQWMEEKYSEMKMQFKQKEFFFNLGFVIYSARL